MPIDLWKWKKCDHIKKKKKEEEIKSRLWKHFKNTLHFIIGQNAPQTIG